MPSAYLVDGAPAWGATHPGGTLHRAVTFRSSDTPWAGCGNAQRLDEDSLVFADEADGTRLCRASGCRSPWN